MKNLNNDISEVLVSEQDLKEINVRLGAQITQDFKDKNLLVVGILKGSIYFMTDLTRYIDLPLKIDFLAVSSYGGSTRSSGSVKIIKDIDIDLEGYDVLLIEDILDSGLTLQFLIGYLSERNPASIEVVTLLRKRTRAQVDIQCAHVGFECPDEFIVGYGLDYAERYRNLPYIGILKPEVYE